MVNLILNDKLRESLQSQVTRQIRALILNQELLPGSSVPSIRTLAKSQNISIITVQHAYNNLEREGLIHARRGKGFYVSLIREKTRKSIAKKRLSQGAEPLIRTANSEGLAGPEISVVIDGLIKKIDEK
jgi:GntR family transcriptional regulator